MAIRNDPLILGSYVAGYESGNAGSSCVAYDGPGGTSYGTYQLSSKMGSLKEFVLWCKTHAPNVYHTLYPIIDRSNTGSTEGEFPLKWKGLCKDGSITSALERAYYIASFYAVGSNRLKERNERAWYMTNTNRALQEVFWSTAVQHGQSGAASVFDDAWNTMYATGNISSDDYIKAIYAERGNMPKRFPRLLKSNPKMAETIKTKRFPEECKAMIALNARMYDAITFE